MTSSYEHRSCGNCLEVTKKIRQKSCSQVTAVLSILGKYRSAKLFKTWQHKLLVVGLSIPTAFEYEPCVSRCNRESVATVQGSALAPTWRCCTCASCLFSWREADREPRPPTVSRLVSPTVHGLLTKAEHRAYTADSQGCRRLLLSSQSNTNSPASRFVVAINAQSEITISVRRQSLTLTKL